MIEARSSNVLYGSTARRSPESRGLMPNSLRMSGCEVASVTVCPRPHAVRATAAPVRPEKMLVTHRTRSIMLCVLPAVTKKFIGVNGAWGDTVRVADSHSRYDAARARRLRRGAHRTLTFQPPYRRAHPVFQHRSGNFTPRGPDFRHLRAREVLVLPRQIGRHVDKRNARREAQSHENRGREIEERSRRAAARVV